MRFRAGEIHERGAEVFLAQQTKIDLQLAVENDADFVFAVSEGLVNGGIAEQVFGNLVDFFLGVVAGLHGEKKVEVADGFAAAAEGAGRSNGFDLRAGFQDVGGVEREPRPRRR